MVKGLSKKYFNDEGTWYKVIEYSFIYEEFKGYDLFEELNDTQKEQATAYCYEAYMDCDSSEISKSIIVEGFIRLLETHSIEEIIEQDYDDFVDSILW